MSPRNSSLSQNFPLVDVLLDIDVEAITFLLLFNLGICLYTSRSFTLIGVLFKIMSKELLLLTTKFVCYMSKVITFID